MDKQIKDLSTIELCAALNIYFETTKWTQDIVREFRKELDSDSMPGMHRISDYNIVPCIMGDEHRNDFAIWVKFDYEPTEVIEIEDFCHQDQPYGDKTWAKATWTQYQEVEVLDCEEWVKEGNNKHLGLSSYNMYKSSRDRHNRCAASGYGEVEGILSKGGSTSWLMGHTSRRDMTGEKHSLNNVSIMDLKRGYKTTVAM